MRWGSALSRICSAVGCLRRPNAVPEWVGSAFMHRVPQIESASRRCLGTSSASRGLHGISMIGRSTSSYTPLATLFTRSLSVTAAKDKIFAVIEVGGKQYKVCENDKVVTEKLVGKRVGEKVNIDKVLLVGTAKETMVGQPLVTGAYVETVVEQQTLSEKLYIFKKRRRKNSRRIRGYRPSVCSLRIIAIHHSGKAAQSVSA